MKRVLLALGLTLGGCYADYVVSTPSGGYVSATIPIGPQPPISVGIAPPPPQYEPFMNCGYGQTYIRGYWDWNGAWYWVPGRCVGAMSGYVYVPPSYSGGAYIRGYWTPRGGGHYGGGGYVPPPAPAYRPPPAPVYQPAPAGPTYVPPPAPAYRPPLAPVYQPAPAVPPPAPSYRAAPAVPPPAPARVGVPPPAPAR